MDIHFTFYSAIHTHTYILKFLALGGTGNGHKKENAGVIKIQDGNISHFIDL